MLVYAGAQVVPMGQPLFVKRPPKLTIAVITFVAAVLLGKFSKDVLTV